MMRQLLFHVCVSISGRKNTGLCKIGRGGERDGERERDASKFDDTKSLMNKTDE